MEMFRIGQAAKASGWSRQWIHSLIERGDVQVEIIGGVVFINSEEVARLREKKRTLKGPSLRPKKGVRCPTCGRQLAERGLSQQANIV